MNEILSHEKHSHGIDKTVKDRLESIINYTADFEEKSLLHSENNAVCMRKQMNKSIQSMKTFNEKSKFIDQKIEYDQRFFNDGYPQF